LKAVSGQLHIGTIAEQTVSWRWCRSGSHEKVLTPCILESGRLEDQEGNKRNPTPNSWRIDTWKNDKETEI
jgi:hypothetical protein